MRTCKKCFRAIDEDAQFCPHCGWDQSKNPHEEEKSQEEAKWSSGGFAGGAGPSYDDGFQADEGTNEAPIYSFLPRNIATAVILSFLTCGLYLLWWIYQLMLEFNELSLRQGQMPPGLSPVLTVVLTFFTGGLFMIYAWTVICRQAAQLTDATGQHLTDYTVLCSLTALANLPGCLIGCAVMQNMLNIFIRYQL